MKLHTYKWDALAKAIEAVKADSDKLQNKIHAIAISILAGWAQDAKRGPEAAQLLTDLQNNAPWHGRAVANWIALVSGMQWAEETSVWYVQKGQKFSKDKLDYAKANPFWEVSPPPKAKPLDIWAAVQALIDKADKHVQKPVDGDVVDQKAIRHLREVLKLKESVDTRSVDADH